MTQKKMNVANITERLSRAEMKQILAGERDGSAASGCWVWDPMELFLICDTSRDCKFSNGASGHCSTTSSGKCLCVGAF